MTDGATDARRAATRARLEAAALGLAAVVPLLPYFAHLAEVGVPRFALHGDYAGLELATRHVPAGTTLLGPYSRFQFNHPGPLYFYALYPVYLLAGKTSAGIFAGAAAIAAAAAAAVVATVRLLATRAHALGVLFVVLGWHAAFGNATPLPWNPLVVVLPLTAFLACAALVARGAFAAAPVAALLGAFVGQTHLSTVPTTLGIGAGALGVAWLGARRRGGLARGERRALAVAGTLVALASLPMLVEQLLPDGGNLTKLARFFAHREAPLAPGGFALRTWAFASTWLPDRLASLALPADGWEPRTMASEAVPGVASGYTIRLTALHLACVGGALALAWKRRDRTSVALLAVSLAADALAVVALQAVVGVSYYYLAFWTTAASTVGWMGVATAVSAALADAARGRVTLSRAGLAGAVAVALAGAVFAASLQRAWLARAPFTPRPFVEFRDMHAAVRAAAEARSAVPVVHAQGAWHLAFMILLERDKDGLPSRIVARERWMLGRQVPVVQGERAMHVWLRTPYHPLEIAPCLERIGASGDLEVFASAEDVTACPSAAP